MLIYLLNFISIPIYNHFIKDRKKFIRIVALQMFIILALREITVGMDLYNYQGGYFYISSLSFVQMLKSLRFIHTAQLVSPYAYESGYALLNWICSKIGCGFHTFLILHAAFCMASFAVFIDRYSKKPWLSFCLLIAFEFYTYAFGVLRQTLAICILLWTIPCIEKRKPLPFFLLLFVAVTMHRVAIIFLPFYFLGTKKITSSVFLINIYLWGWFFVVSPFLFEYVIAKVMLLIGKGSYVNVEWSWNHMITLMLLLGFAMLFLTNFDRKRSRTEDLIYWGFLLGVPIEIVGLNNDVVARAVQFYFIFIIVLLPNLLNDYREEKLLLHYKTKKVTTIGEILLAIAAFVFTVYNLYGSMLVPYMTI